MQTACFRACYPPTQWSLYTAPTHLSPNQTHCWTAFCHLLSLFFPASLPSSLSHSQLTSPGAELLLVCNSHLLFAYRYLAPSSSTVGGHQEKKELELTLYTRDCLLQLSAATLLAGKSLWVTPEVTLLCKMVQTQFDHLEDLWWKGRWKWTLQSTQSCWILSQSSSVQSSSKFPRFFYHSESFLGDTEQNISTQTHFKPSLWGTWKTLEIDSKMT